MLTKRETLSGRGTQAESRRVREPGRTAPPRGSVSGFMVMGLVSCCLWSIVLTQSPSWWCTRPSAKMMPARRILGGW